MLPSLPFNVLYFFPGYIRLKIGNIKNNHAYAKKIEDVLITVHGISKAEANPITGSLLIRYNPKSIDVERLIKVGMEDNFIPENQGLDIEFIKKTLTRGIL